MRIIYGIFGFIPFIMWTIYSIHAGITYDQDVGGHLKRAADANSVALAVQELDVAINNMEERGYTEGYTSIVYNTPDEDVGFWYTNIKASRMNLLNLPKNADPLTVSNELMKLRETLLDHGDSGEHVTDPPGIKLFPANTAYAFFGWGGVILAVVTLIVIVVKREMYI